MNIQSAERIAKAKEFMGEERFANFMVFIIFYKIDPEFWDSIHILIEQGFTDDKENLTEYLAMQANGEQLMAQLREEIGK